MLQIEHRDKIEKTTIGDLFRELGYDAEEPTEFECPWPLEVLSFDNFYAVEGFRKVEKQPTMKLKTECGKELEGALDHIVLTHETGWTKMKDLEVGQKLISHNHSPVITDITETGESKMLYDFQVSIAHSFMTNDILSHNSHFLVAMGAAALRQRRNVLHYTFELTETAVGRRYDSNLVGINSNELVEHKEKVLDFYNNHEGLGRLIIKEYPTGFASVVTVRNHIEKLSLKGFRPDLIVIDYADIMRSTKTYESLRHELKLVYEELRNLAMEMNIPVWTASQANRDAANSDIVGLENMSEAYGKAMVADVVVSLSRKPEEKANGTGRLFVAKNRAGRDGILFPMAINTAQSSIRLLDENNEMTLTEAFEKDQKKAKELLRQKWKEVTHKLDTKDTQEQA